MGSIVGVGEGRGVPVLLLTVGNQYEAWVWTGGVPPESSDKSLRLCPRSSLWNLVFTLITQCLRDSFLVDNRSEVALECNIIPVKST